MLKKLFRPVSDWSLHNPLKGWTLHGLSLREARLVVGTLSHPESKTVMAWRPGLANWFLLETDVCRPLRPLQTAAVPGVPVIPSLTPEEEITAVKIQRPSVRTQGREHERVPVAVAAEILLGGQRFRTMTENVSWGGIKFRERLPDWVAGYFTVILTRPEGSFEVTCMLVEDQKNDKTRVEVVETDDEESHLPLYRSWVGQMLPPGGS